MPTFQDQLDFPFSARSLALLYILTSRDFRDRIEAQGGYDEAQAGAVEWVG
jgi:hypothetical protein